MVSEVNPVALTSRGSCCAALVTSPSPSWPKLLLPQHDATPSASSPQLLVPPAAIESKVRPSAEGPGSTWSGRRSLPSWPDAKAPQHDAAPSAVRPQAWS